MHTFYFSLLLQAQRLRVFIVVLGLLAGFTALHAQNDKKADDDYLGANGLFNLGLYEQAIGSYQEFLKNYPNHSKVINVRYGMGISHFQLKQYDKAAEELGKVVGDPKCPDKPRANLFWGQSLLMLRKPANAEGAFAAGIKALPASKDEALLSNLQVSQLEALFQQKKWKNVVGVAKTLKGKVGDRSTRVAFQGAFALYELKQFKEAGTALASLKPSVKNTPYEQQTHFLLAESLREQKQFPLAIREFEVAAGLKGDFATEALYRLGFLQFNQRNYKAAAKNFDDFRVKYRDSVGKEKPEQFQDALIYLGRSQMELSQYAVAEKVFSDLAGESKAGAKVFLWQCRVLNRQKKYADAVKVLDDTIKKFPNDSEMPNLLFDLANNNLGLDNFAEAGKAFDDLRKTKPDFAQMGDLLRLNALCKHRTKDFAGSLKLCGDFLNDHKDHGFAGDVTFLEAENQFFLNQEAKAIDSYGSFLVNYKTHVQVNAARMRVGQSHYKLKNWTKALASLEPLVKVNSKGLVFDQLEFLVADIHYQLGDWAKAVPAYLQFVETKPKSTNADTALIKAGLASEELKKKGDAIAAYKKLESSYADSIHLPHARLQLGVLYYNGKKYADARAVLQKVAALKEHKLRPNVEYYLGWVALGEKELAVAAQQFGVVADNFPKHELAGDCRLQQGAMLLDVENFADAQKALEKFIADYTKHEKIDQATYQLGFSQMKQDQWLAALANFAKVTAESDWRDDALYQSAWCQKGSGKSQNAVPHYEELLAEFPKSPLANASSLELAELEYEAKKLNEVIRRLQGLIVTKPKKDLLSRAQYRLGWAHFDLKNFAEAAKVYEAMLSAAPEDLLVTAAYQAGESRLQSTPSQPAEALVNFQKAIKAKKPAEPSQVVLQEQALLRVGLCQGKLPVPKWVDSEKAFKQFMVAYPKHDHIRTARHGLGQALKNQEKYDVALKEFESVLSEAIRDELGAHSQFLLGECYLERKMYDQAIAEYVKVETLYAFPQWQSKAIYEMGKALDGKGDKTNALAQYKRLIQKFPDTPAAAAAKEELK